MRRAAALLVAAAFTGCGSGGSNSGGSSPSVPANGSKGLEPPEAAARDPKLIAALGDSITAGSPLWDPDPAFRERIAAPTGMAELEEHLPRRWAPLVDRRRLRRDSTLGGDGDEPRAAATTSAATATAAPAKVDRFNATRAFRDLEYQVKLGPRPAGSPASRKLIEWARRRLPSGRVEKVAGGLRNVVGRIPGAKPAILVSAHYDTKDMPGFVGAEDGAGGTAAVLELARYFRRAKRPEGAPALRFALFDGEENPDDSQPFEEGGLRGSKAYAKRHDGELKSLILLDFVGAKDLRIFREALSDAALWDELRAAAGRVGAQAAFPRGIRQPITDDHVPFLERGVPAIDLIQWPYDCWHQPCDDMSAVSEQSLDASGEAVLRLVRRLGGT